MTAPAPAVEDALALRLVLLDGSVAVHGELVHCRGLAGFGGCGRVLVRVEFSEALERACGPAPRTPICLAPACKLSKLKLLPVLGRLRPVLER